MMMHSGALPKAMALFEEGRQKHLHSGMQIYVSLRGKPLFDNAVGDAADPYEPGENTSPFSSLSSPSNVLGKSRQPMQRDTLNLWLSSGKPLTVVAVAQLWEKGELSFDDPVCRFIPEFGQQGKEAITIRHLLTHTGGFRSADEIPPEISWDKRIHRICQAPLEPDWSPGKKAGYHMTCSWFLLGEIARRLDGRAFERYIRDEILLPLGMVDSWLGMSPEHYQKYQEEHRIAVMHVRNHDKLNPHSFFNTAPAFTTCRPGSNACGPIRELGRFYEFLLGQFSPAKPILRPETIGQLVSRQREGLFDHTFCHKIDFGLGFIVNSNRHRARASLLRRSKSNPQPVVR